jgi:hypothetical protein
LAHFSALRLQAAWFCDQVELDSDVAKYHLHALRCLQMSLN